MKRIKKTVLFAAAALALTSCLKPVVSVNAGFTTDKEVYELYEEVKITNKSESSNDIIVACKWEWGNEYKWGKHLEEPISFDTEGEKEIKLTVVTDSNVSATCVKTITVQDTNQRPVADFVYALAPGSTNKVITAGDEVQFTDKSYDPDGSIVSWEWKIGANVVTGQNPQYKFNEAGDIEVTLTVTDNQRGKGSVTKVIHVEKSKDSLELLWSKSYDNDTEARVIFTSPAVSPDGKTVYAYSSGSHLVAFNQDGTQKWSFNAGVHNPGITKNFSTCTPSVDEDGTIFFIAGNKDTQDKTGATETGIYAVNPDGSQKWYYPYAYGWFINVIPVVFKDQVFVGTKRNPSVGDFPALWPDGGADNGLLINKANGTYFNYLQVKRGTHGGFAATKTEDLIVHTDSKYGARVYWKEGEGWKYYGAAAGQNAFMLGYIGNKNTEIGFTSYMAVDKDNKVYMLLGHANGAGSDTAPAALYCYDLNKYDKNAGISHEWVVDLEGNNKMYYSLGTVLGEDGTVYVTTTDGVTAVSADGTKKWFAAASGNVVMGSPAVDKNGYVYYNETNADQTAGKLVKLNPDGQKVAEMTLGQSLCSSPTIGPDGTIYCTGVNDNKPTLSAIKGTADGPASGWSQLGGNYRKTCKFE